MVAVALDQHHICFIARHAGAAQSIYLAGDFNGWQPQPMTKQADNSFQMTVPLPRGIYEYCFVVDGRWEADPANRKWTVSPYGTFNSVVFVDLGFE